MRCLAPGCVVPPRKVLPEATSTRATPRPRRARSRAPSSRPRRPRSARAAPSPLVTSDDLPPLDGGDFRGDAPAAGPLHGLRGRIPSIGDAFVAHSAIVAGDVRLADDAGIYFGCVVHAGAARIAIGRRTNVQDNTFLVTDAGQGDLVVGENVTFGHNVRMGAGRIEDDALIGMASRVAHGVIVERGACIAAGAWVEPGTVVKAGWIWAGRPARAFREVRPAEREAFAYGVDVYVRYGRVYLAQRTPAA